MEDHNLLMNHTVVTTTSRGSKLARQRRLARPDSRRVVHQPPGTAVSRSGPGDGTLDGAGARRPAPGSAGAGRPGPTGGAGVVAGGSTTGSGSTGSRRPSAFSAPSTVGPAAGTRTGRSGCRPSRGCPWARATRCQPTTVRFGAMPRQPPQQVVEPVRPSIQPRAARQVQVDPQHRAVRTEPVEQRRVPGAPWSGGVSQEMSLVPRATMTCWAAARAARERTTWSIPQSSRVIPSSGRWASSRCARIPWPSGPGTRASASRR